MNDIITPLYAAVIQSQKNLPIALAFIGILYVIFIFNKLFGNVLTLLSVYPRRWFGIFGILFYPFIHQDFNHIFFNTVPLFLLSLFVLLAGFTTFVCVTATITVLSGLAIWLLGRPAYHLGASGLIMGYWSYLLMNAYQQTTAVSMASAVVCIYYFGGLIFQLIPSDVRTSWEAHVYGFAAGLAAAYTCPALFCAILPSVCYRVSSLLLQ